jgi:IS30 family transposase
MVVLRTIVRFEAQARAEANRARPKVRKPTASARLHDAVDDGLQQKWSPEQVSKRQAGSSRRSRHVDIA